MTDRKAMELALEALAAADDFLFNYHECEPNHEREMDAYSAIRANNHAAFTALRERLAQPEQEPVDVGQLEYFGNSVDFIHRKMTAYRNSIDAAWDALRSKGIHPDGNTSVADAIAKYTTPPQRKPLTDEEIEDIWADCPADWDDTINVLTLARAIEAAHGIKGGSMNQDDIIRMAREAHKELVTKDYPGHLGQLDPWTMRLIERFAALVAAAERKRWEDVKNYLIAARDGSMSRNNSEALAAALLEQLEVAAENIRARGQDPMPLFDDWGGIPYKSCPPCNQQCNQGRDCPNA